LERDYVGKPREGRKLKGGESWFMGVMAGPSQSWGGVQMPPRQKVMGGHGSVNVF